VAFYVFYDDQLVWYISKYYSNFCLKISRKREEHFRRASLHCVHGKAKNLLFYVLFKKNKKFLKRINIKILTFDRLILPVRSEKAGRFEKLLAFARSDSILTHQLVSRAPPHYTPPTFLNLNGSHIFCFTWLSIPSKFLINNVIFELYKIMKIIKIWFYFIIGYKL